MGMDENRFWSMPIGEFLDLWACHKQYVNERERQFAQQFTRVNEYGRSSYAVHAGAEKPVRQLSIDEVLPV
jgi:hypothetical protein